MSTWRRKFSKRSQRGNESNESFLNNTVKYRKKLQMTVQQINRTRKFSQRNLESSDSEIQIARLFNEVGQLSDCKSLQEISSLIDSLAARYQLSSRIFNEYSMNSLQKSLETLNDSLGKDFEKSKAIFDEAVTNNCSDLTKRQLFNKVENEWSKHKSLAVKELKNGLSSYCHIGLYNLRIQMSMLEKLQNFVDKLPEDENVGLPEFTANSLQTRNDIDSMLRIMLDTAPNLKQPKSFNEELTISNEEQTLRRQNTPRISHPPPRIHSASSTVSEETEPMVFSPLTSRTDGFESESDDDHLPSYNELFDVPTEF